MELRDSSGRAVQRCHMVLNSYFSENKHVCLHSLKVVPVMRLKSKEYILEN